MRVLAPAAFVEQYDPPQDEYQAKPWQLVTDYRQVQAYAAEHPDAGRVAVGNALGLPPSRVRGWLQGGKPDAVRGLHRAQAKDWVPLDSGDDVFRFGLNKMVAWVFSGGSINSRFVPSFAVADGTDREHLQRIAAAANIELTVVREGDSQRATELRPPDDGAVLGRALVAMGAPQGTKNQTSDVRLPAYLDDISEEARSDFARTYLHNRLTHTAGRTVRQFRESRSEAYLDSLRQFLGDVLEVDVHRSGHNIYLADLPEIVDEEAVTQ